MSADSAPAPAPETPAPEGISWPNELGASVVVFLVALPLCMGIAIASNVPIEKGILTGIVGGLIIGAYAGCPLQVSGPAAGLAVMVADLVANYGLEALGPVVLLAGLIQIGAGMLHLGQWFRAVSPSVISGMLAGIGALIFCSQFHVMVDDKPRGSGLQNLLSLPEAVYKGIFPTGDAVHHQAAFVGIATLATLILLNRWRPGPLKYVPPPLGGVIVGALVSHYYDLGIQHVTVKGSLFTAIEWPTTKTMGMLTNDGIILMGIAFAFVASAETLLCATAVDQMHDGERTKYDKELVAQGLGNTVCGLIGALPATGVIVRSTANIESGAKTRASAIFHGVWMLAAVAAFPQILEHIPRASLAGVLVYTGYKLMNPEKVRKLMGYGRSEVLIYAATVTTIVCGDLLKGVVLGIALSMGKLLYTFSQMEATLVVDEEEGVAVLKLVGNATFVRLPQLAANLERVPPGSVLRIRLEELEYIDHACLDLITNFESQHSRTGGKVEMAWRDLNRRYFQRNQGLDKPGTAGNKALVEEVSADDHPLARVHDMEPRPDGPASGEGPEEKAAEG